MGVKGGGHRCTSELRQKGRAARGLENADSKQKSSNFRKMQVVQLSLFKIGVTLHPSLTGKGQPALHDIAWKYLLRASVKNLSPTHWPPHHTPDELPPA